MLTPDERDAYHRSDLRPEDGASSVTHIGRHTHRLSPKADNPREVIFSKEWESHQHPPGFLNGGIGILHMLLYSQGNGRVNGDVTQEQAESAATAIQWLGSPVGFSWLTETLGKMGYAVVQTGQKS